MVQLLRNQWIRTALVVVVMAVLAAALAAAVASRSDSAPSVGDRVMLTTGGSVATDRWLVPGDKRWSEELPLTAAEAVAAGWTDPILCSTGRGRYFRRSQEGEDVPYFLMYNNVDELISIYHYSEQEMPPPWERLSELRGGAGVAVLDQHWGLFVYFQDPIQACAASDKTAVGTGGSSYYGAHAVRSYQVGATPAPALALEAIAQQMAAVKSLSLSFTSEPEGTPLMPAIQAVTIQGSVVLPADVTLQATDAAGATSEVSAHSVPFDFTDLGVKIGTIARAMQGPEDTARQWIDNVPSRGVAGTVQGEHLAVLVPSVPAEVQLTVQMWFSDDGLVRRVRIEGPLAPNDPPGVARVLELSDFE